MISRRTTRLLAEAYQFRFTYSWFDMQRFDAPGFYDFLFEHEYPAWFCSKARSINNPREGKELIMGLHTGETQQRADPNWTSEKGQQLGQQFLRDLAEDLLQDFPNIANWRGRRFEEYVAALEKLDSSLELDGYLFHDDRLLDPDTDAIDSREEAGILDSLYSSLGLPHHDIFINHLKLSVDHYIDHKYGDSISNSRHFLEIVLREVANAISLQRHGTPLASADYERPVKVREFLEGENFLTTDEVMTVAKIYRLISNTGGHPNLSQNDEARFARQLALIVAQYMLIRLVSMTSTDGAASTQAIIAQ